MDSGYEDREQTAVKHQILTRYLSAFAPIVGDWASDIAYIDCLAGPWRSVHPSFKDSSFARAIDVLRSTREVLRGRGKNPTMRCLFIENNPAAFLKLQEFCSGVTDIEVAARPWDFTEHVQDVIRFVRERTNSFPFFFVDPKGWDPLQIEIIRPLLILNPNEFLINLMTSSIRRFLTDETKGFDRLVGADRARLAKLRGDEQEEALVDSYTRALRRAGGFKYICSLPVMKPDQDAFHFHMIYCTRHIKGVEEFKRTEKHVIPFMHETRAQAQERRRVARSGQKSMFTAQEHYKEAKFTRFQLRSLDLAKAELQNALRDSKQLEYEEGYSDATLGSDGRRF
jgi:three-Cys-motif partner protein